MKKNKGFTLIELLAVIIILAVIALIATPIVLNVIENTKKKAFEQSAVGYYNAARYVYDEMYLKNDRQDVLFSFENGELTSNNKEYNLGVGGEIPKGGLIHLSSNGDVSVAIHNNKYCAIVDEKGNTTLSENLSECGVIPTECFIVDDVGLIEEDLKIIQEYNLLGKIGLQDKIHSIVGIDTGNEICANLKNIIFPSEIDGQAIEMVGVGDSEYEGFSGSYNNIILENGIKYIEFFGDQNLECNNFYIPDSVRGISAVVFDSGNIDAKNVKLSKGLVYIGDNNFHKANVSSIVLPEIVYIGSNSFFECQISSLNIGNKVKVIPFFDFEGKKEEQQFIFIGNETGNIDNYTLHQYIGPKNTKVIIPDGVHEIGLKAFYNKGITGIVIPDSVITIDNISFLNNQLTNVIIPNSVTNIGYSAFQNNKLTNVTIGSSVTSIQNEAFANNSFSSPDAITIEGDSTRFDNIWTSIGFPAK